MPKEDKKMNITSRKNSINNIPTNGTIDTKFLIKLRESKEQDLGSKKRAAYARVSTKEQAISGFGIDVQIANIKSQLKNQGIDPNDVEFYVDDGYSAKNLNRPAMQRLLVDILAGKVNEILIYKLDRLARNVIDTYELLQFFIDQKCELKAIVDNLDIHSANGRLLVGVLAIIAQWERETIRERVVDTQIEMLEEGRYPFGQIPFGWILDENKYPHVNEKEASFLIFCFNLAISGSTMKEIECKAAQEFPDFQKKSETIRRLLLRKLNYGIVEYIDKEYSIPRIITKQTYDKARKMIYKRYKETDTNKYYFGNKIKDVCGDVCERKSTNKKLRNGHKKYYYYTCPTCKKRISQDRLIEGTIPRILMFANGQSKNKEISKISNRLKTLDSKAREIFIEFTNDRIDGRTYGCMIGNIEREKQKTINRLTVLEKASGMSMEEWNNMEDGCKKQYIDEYITEIIVDTSLNLIISIVFKDKKSSK